MRILSLSRLNFPAGDVSIAMADTYIRVVKYTLCDIFSVPSLLLPLLPLLRLMLCIL